MTRPSSISVSVLFHCSTSEVNMNQIIDHLKHLGRTFEELFISGDDHDAVLVVKDHRFSVHRIILGTQSDFFHKLFFDNQFLEGETGLMNIDAPPASFETVLRYMYTGKMDLEPKDLDDVLEIFELSRRFGLPRLEKALVDFLVKIADNENLALMIRTAELFDAEILMVRCCTILNQHDRFLDCAELLHLTESEVIRLCFHERLEISMFNKFQGIARWLAANPACKSREKILDSIDLFMLTNTELLTTVSPSKVIDGLKILKVLEERENAKPSVVVGVDCENLSSDRKFVSALKAHKQWEMVIDLGTFITFNYLEFNIGEEFCSKLVVECSSRKGDWKHLKTQTYCRSMQAIHIPNGILSRWIKIHGPHKVNQFKVMNLPKIPDIRDGFICPKENICVAETAFIKGGVSQFALSGNFAERGLETPFTEGDKFRIRFNQPYFLRKCRFRLWDFDGRKQCFSFSCINLDGISVETQEFHEVDGWLTVDINWKVYGGFAFIGSKCNHRWTNKRTFYDSSVRLVHIDATA